MTSHDRVRTIEELWVPHIEFESVWEPNEPLHITRSATTLTKAEAWLDARRVELNGRVKRAWLEPQRGGEDK